ncbi:MAG: molybdenum cofactor biosynthesis protein MoaE [Armatimonadota bacterium]|nr:molybdenum cofactor biosynthesis protein MoaE [Armatimonadota bacterium]
MIAIVEGELPINDVVRAVEAAQGGAMGALVTFVGTVRNYSMGHTIEYLEYSAYKPMAEKQMRQIAREVHERWGLPCAMAHRVGRLHVGEASIVVAVAAPHRKEAFAACHYAVERVKESVPIWKKEVATDGSWWVEDPLSLPIS